MNKSLIILILFCISCTDLGKVPGSFWQIEMSTGAMDSNGKHLVAPDTTQCHHLMMRDSSCVNKIFCRKFIYNPDSNLLILDFCNMIADTLKIIGGASYGIENDSLKIYFDSQINPYYSGKLLKINNSFLIIGDFDNKQNLILYLSGRDSVLFKSGQITKSIESIINY